MANLGEAARCCPMIPNNTWNKQLVRMFLLASVPPLLAKLPNDTGTISTSSPLASYRREEVLNEKPGLVSKGASAGSSVMAISCAAKYFLLIHLQSTRWMTDFPY